MKKLLFVALFCISFNTFSMKVKFAVDMTGVTVLATGMHVMGNFQAIAGFPNGDWQPNTTSLTREGTTDVYSITLDLPGNRAYQYRYLNGDQTYEAEFVPEESRIGWNFNDNRWIYVDSLNADTFKLPVLLFGGNAPLNKKLLRLRIDFSRVGDRDAGGLHVAGDFNNWDYTSAKMYSFEGRIYEYLTYVDSNSTIGYRFINGTSSAKKEIINGSCADSNTRVVVVTSDKLTDTLCYGYCISCATILSTTNPSPETEWEVFPNPAIDQFELRFANSELRTIQVLDATGKVVYVNEQEDKNNFVLDGSLWEKGLYLIRVITHPDQTVSCHKLILQ